MTSPAVLISVILRSGTCLKCRFLISWMLTCSSSNSRICSLAACRRVLTCSTLNCFSRLYWKVKKQATTTHENVSSSMKSRWWNGRMEFLRIEAVAIAVAGNDVVAITADFPAKASDVNVNGSVEYDDFAFPYLVQYFFSCEHNAFVGKEER